MSVFIRISCDTPECQNAVMGGFERPTETYGDLMESLRAAGWNVTWHENVATITCPPCEKSHD